jgi:hypothetical protein
VAECWRFALDRQAARPAGTTGLPASLVASTPGGDIPRRAVSTQPPHPTSERVDHARQPEHPAVVPHGRVGSATTGTVCAAAAYQKRGGGMRTRRLVAVSAVVAVVCSALLAGQPVALGKDNITARLLTPLRLDAAPGDKITVVWGLAGTDEHGQRQPFNAIGVFVRAPPRRSDSRPRTPTPKDATTPRWPCPRAGSAASRSGWAAPATAAPAKRCSRWRTTRSPHQLAGWPPVSRQPRVTRCRRGWPWPVRWRCWACLGPWSGECAGGRQPARRRWLLAGRQAGSLTFGTHQAPSRSTAALDGCKVPPKAAP